MMSTPILQSTPFKTFIKDFTKKIEAGEAAFFIGAGFSQSVGYSNWKELLRDLADEIGLSVDRETDLISLAQYYENKRGNRAKINENLIEKYSQDAKPHINHKLLAQLPVQTVWTTNYDRLLEDGYKSIRKRVDAKITESNLSQSKLGRDVVLYKMHGDIEQPQNAVLTRRDYDRYSVTHGLFTEALKGDLISKTFLFLGFSFTDPNIDYVLSRIHVLLNKDVRDHYCIMRRPQKPKRLKGKAKADYEYEMQKLEHRIADLRNYGVQVLHIDAYEDITNILNELNRQVQAKHIFVSGSAHDYEPLGQERFERLCYQFGQEIIKRGYNLTSGFGLGVGRHIISGALEEIYKSDSSVAERLTMRPFPHSINASEKADVYKRYRTDMLSTVRYSIILGGRSSGDPKPSGLKEEFDIAVELGVYPIPIGATGHTAEILWNEVNNNLDRYYPNTELEELFRIIADPKRNNEEIIQAVFKIIESVQESVRKSF
jgi:hypothetical protein